MGLKSAGWLGAGTLAIGSEFKLNSGYLIIIIMRLTLHFSHSLTKIMRSQNHGQNQLLNSRS